MFRRSFTPARKSIYGIVLSGMILSLFMGASGSRPVQAEGDVVGVEGSLHALPVQIAPLEDPAAPVLYEKSSLPRLRARQIHDLEAMRDDPPPEPPMPIIDEIGEASTGNEVIYIDPGRDFVCYYYWDPSIPGTVTIDDPGTGTNPDAVHVVTTNSYGSGCWFSEGERTIDILPGFYVTVTAGTVTKTHTVTTLEVTDADIDLDDVFGTAAAWSHIEVITSTNNISDWASSEAGAGGDWTVDFSGIADLNSETFGWAYDWTGDSDKDGTIQSFTLPIPNLTVIKAGTGIGTVSSTPIGISCGTDCTESFTPGTVVKLTAAASPGSLFTGWSGAGCSGLKFCWVTMNAAKSVTATFTTIPPGTFPLTVVKGGAGSGTATSTPAGISCGTDCWEFYTAGTAVRLSAAASPGSTFIGWSGACGSLDYCWLGMGASKYVTANFALTPPGTFPLIVAMKGKGTGTVTSNVPGISCWPDCYEFYTSGTLVRLAAVAAPGSTFSGWSGGCGGTAYCWLTLSQARFVTANWVLNTTSLPSLDADLALLRDPFAFFTFLTRPLEGLTP